MYPCMLKLPRNASVAVDAHRKWLKTVKDARALITSDAELQRKAATGFRLKERKTPPEVIGRLYAQYCLLANEMYDAYLSSIQLQRSEYILELSKVVMKRIYELRSELVQIIVNDYIYVDSSLRQMRLTPYDIEIVVPSHYASEFRPDTMESLLQKMWIDAVKRKLAPPKKPKVVEPMITGDEEEYFFPLVVEEESEEIIIPVESVHTVIPQEFLHVLLIQTHERFRQSFVRAFKQACKHRKMYSFDKSKVAPKSLRNNAAVLIQMAYRQYMKIKRQRVLEIKRDMILGIIPYPVSTAKHHKDEKLKIYNHRRDKRLKIMETYLREMEREKVKLLLFKKDDQMEDITEHIREWFKEWYYGYGFFPQYPYETEGGTVVVIRGDYPTIEEQQEEDERFKTLTKGKSPDQIKNEKEQAEQDRLMKEELLREKLKKEAENLFKMRCNPMADPGHLPMLTGTNIVEALRKYTLAWDYYDKIPPEIYLNVIFGYMKPFLTEDLMAEIHTESRRFVDEFMRLELKLLVKNQQAMYKRVGWKYPKMRPRKRPKVAPPPKVFVFDDGVPSQIEDIFDLDIITKPTRHLEDVVGDLNYVNYEYNIEDPKATFPPPCYGDVRRRLIMSCIHGMGFAEGPKRNKSILLVGPPSNGKSFLVDVLCGEIRYMVVCGLVILPSQADAKYHIDTHHHVDAVKLDISPEVFNVKVSRPARKLPKVFMAAKTFQPAVVFYKNIERVFCKKVQPNDKRFKAKAVKGALVKQVKGISNSENVMFIATCSFPLLAKARPMVSLFSEVIMVPRVDYASLRQFFYYKLQSIRSIPRDYCVMPIAKLLEGYGFGTVMNLYDSIMTPERIIRLNVTPLSLFEFLEPLLQAEVEPMAIEEYNKYCEWFIKNSPLSKKREEYALINAKRAAFYSKMKKKEDD